MAVRYNSNTFNEAIRVRRIAHDKMPCHYAPEKQVHERPLPHVHHNDTVPVLVPTPIKIPPPVGLDGVIPHPSPGPQLPQTPHVSL
jgi:hypothetical protein